MSLTNAGRLLFLVVLCLLPPFASTDLRAQDRSEKTSLPSPRETASLSLQIDKGGMARVALAIPGKFDDVTPMRLLLSQSFNFPLVIDPPGKNPFEDEDGETPEKYSWTLIEAHNDQAFVGQALVSGASIQTARLAEALRPLGIKTLSIITIFLNEPPYVKVTGASQVGPKGMNFYQVSISTENPDPAGIDFSWGYRPRDLVVQLLPTGLFILLPLLLTLWMTRSVLKIQDRPTEMWGRYFRFLFRLISFIWLIWIPVCSLSNLGEITSTLIGPNHTVLAETLSLAYYFVPPILVVYLCHFLSGRVYRAVRGAEWSAREVMSRAILATAFSIVPLFFVMLTINTFAAGTRHAGVFLIVGFACWLIWGSFAGKAFNISMYAVTSGELRDRVFELAQRAGVTLKQIYVLPQEKAQMSNAFARGDNAVMLTASLLKHLSKREVDGIIAHEIGHLKEKHPRRSSWATIITIFVTSLVVSALASILQLQRSTPVIFSISMTAAILVLHFVSRSNERHADAIGVSLTGDPEAFISGLAKLSRLNLMPLHSAGWGESLETHPQTMRRLSDIARVHAISDQRLAELLALTDSPNSGYSTTEGSVEETKIFSTDLKKRYQTRQALVFLAVILLAPVPLVVLLPRIHLDGVALKITFLVGVFVSFGVYQFLRNFVCFWGHQSLEQRLRAKLSQQGFAEAAENGVAVGLSPAAESRKYEEYLFWDIGILWLTSEKLYYLGEGTQFALERSQIHDAYLENSRSEWLPDKNLYIRLFEKDCEAGEAFHFQAVGARSVLQGRRELASLRDRLHAWMAQTEHFPAAPASLQSIVAPRFPAVTSQPASNRFSLSLVLKASMQIACMSAVVSFALRFSFSNACLAMGVVVFFVFFDELPKLLHRHPSSTNSGPPTELQTTPTYGSGSWAESTPATTQSIE